MIARPQQQLQPAKAQPQLRPGANVLMGKNPLGAWFDSTPAANDFRHPFTVNAGGGSARVSRGLVIANIAVEPLIGKVPVGGDDKNPQPVLKLDPSLVDAAGHSWICVEVTPDENGGFSARMPDFPGCFAEGETAAEALANLERAALSWLEAALDQGLAVPPTTREDPGRGGAPWRGVSTGRLMAAPVAQRTGTKRTAVSGPVSE